MAAALITGRHNARIINRDNVIIIQIETKKKQILQHVKKNIKETWELAAAT